MKQRPGQHEADDTARLQIQVCGPQQEQRRDLYLCQKVPALLQLVVGRDLLFQKLLIIRVCVTEGNPGRVAHQCVELAPEQERFVQVPQDERPDAVAVFFQEAF